MAKSEATLKLEDDIRAATLKMGVFGCLEVTIGFGGKERVDYMTYDTQGIFRCYEIKVTKSDFHSKHSNSFVGHYNYYVLTQELYEQVKDEIPSHVGCYIGQNCVKKPKKQDLSEKVFSFWKIMNGKSTQVEIPYIDMMKDSIIRSLYRDSQKYHRGKSKNYVDQTRNRISELERSMSDYRNRYNILYNNIHKILGRASLSLLLYEKLFDLEERQYLTKHQEILTMNKSDMARFLYDFQNNNLSLSKIEHILGVSKSELQEKKYD